MSDDALLSDAEIEEQAARMFYRMEGWEKYWPYEQRPEWLRRVKYPTSGIWPVRSEA